MQFIVLLLTTLAALTLARPSHQRVSEKYPNAVAIIMTTPDCAPLESYCTHCNGDFNCQTDPRCEWCDEMGEFGDGNN
ncbi:hypothetical protein F5Y18DRAFT_313384 [Xylariaceae sp. FL1019]|nr:hypothetical protein F5Y18DRAFT_313384 [Xylariaceae sp. FL1019]